MKRLELTHDQRKAAEAAFRGRPADPGWSAGAHCVYEGLVKALPGTSAPLLRELSREAARDPRELGKMSEVGPPPWISPEVTPDDGWSDSTDEELGLAPPASRDEAIEVGRLIDITSQADDLGLPMPVGLTRSLWDFAITAADAVPDDQHLSRVRDLLSALQYHLRRFPVVAPFSQFPALLCFPPSLVPQLCAVCVVAHSDPNNGKFLTLLLPSELPEHMPPFTSEP